MKREYTAPECAEELGVTTRTWYAWIRAGLLRKAPIVRTGGAGRGGKRCFWLPIDLRRAAQVQRLLEGGLTMSEVGEELRRRRHGAAS